MSKSVIKQGSITNHSRVRSVYVTGTATHARAFSPAAELWVQMQN